MRKTRGLWPFVASNPESCSCFPSSGALYCHQNSLMSHRVDDKIDSEAESFDRRLEGIRASIDIVPEVFQIVVIAGDDADLSVLVHQRVENRFAVHEIRR